MESCFMSDRRTYSCCHSAPFTGKGEEAETLGHSQHRKSNSYQDLCVGGKKTRKGHNRSHILQLKGHFLATASHFLLLNVRKWSNMCDQQSESDRYSAYGDAQQEKQYISTLEKLEPINKTMSTMNFLWVYWLINRSIACLLSALFPCTVLAWIIVPNALIFKGIRLCKKWGNGFFSTRIQRGAVKKKAWLIWLIGFYL